MENHPIADIWPMMAEDELSSLSADIKKNGLINSIWLYEGKILDGRNRHKACEMAGIKPIFREFTGENPVAFVFSCNSERRHLTSGQRAAIAVEIKPRLEEEAKKRQGKRTDLEPNFVQKIEQCSPNNNKAITQAAKITGTNREYVNQAEKIKEKAPEIFNDLKAGKITMQEAKKKCSMVPMDPWTEDENKRKATVLRGGIVLANAEKDKNLIQWSDKEGLSVYIDRSSNFGNPFILDKDGSRSEVCEKYEKYYLPHKPSILRNLVSLSGKVLICHCYPEKCHGESLIKAAAPRLVNRRG